MNSPPSGSRLSHRPTAESHRPSAFERPPPGIIPKGLASAEGSVTSAEVVSGASTRNLAAVGIPDWISLSSGCVFALTLGAVLFATLGSPMKDDIAWLLHVAREWLSGRRLYADLVEVNPPLIVWLSAVPVTLGELTRTSPAPFAVGLAAGVVTACAWWSAALLRGYSALFRRRAPVFAAVAFVLLILPGVEFGQREHLLVAATLPYLCVFAQRLKGRAIPVGTALSVGLVAGLGCALKPYYALPFLLLEAVASRQSLRPWRVWRAELVSAIFSVLVYAAAVVAFYPGYLGSAVPLALDLYSATDASPMRLLLYGRTLLFGEIVLLVLWFTRPAPLRRDALLLTLLVFGCGATAAYFLQGKDWFYHRIPATTAIVLTLAYWTAHTALSRCHSRRMFVAHAAAAVCALALFAQAAAERLAPRFAEALTPQNTIEAKLERILRREHARSYMAFSQSLSVAFPVVNESGVAWSSRFDSMWALRGELVRMHDSHGRSLRRWPVRQWIASDFITHCPDVVVVDDRDGLDYPAILSAASPPFAWAWRGYAEIAVVHHSLRIFERQGPAACTAPPR